MPDPDTPAVRRDPDEDRLMGRWVAPLRAAVFAVVGAAAVAGVAAAAGCSFGGGGRGYTQNEYEMWVDGCSTVAASTEGTPEEKALVLYDCVEGFINGRGR